MRGAVDLLAKLLEATLDNLRLSYRSSASIQPAAALEHAIEAMNAATELCQRSSKKLEVRERDRERVVLASVVRSPHLHADAAARPATSSRCGSVCWMRSTPSLAAHVSPCAARLRTPSRLRIKV